MSGDTSLTGKDLVMAQTSRPQSPWPPAQNQDAFMPPAKRQRLSPNPVSPYTNSPSTPYAGSPSYANIALPTGAFSNNRPNAVLQQDVTARAQTGVMGPPQRPAERAGERPPGQKDEKPLDINELNDLVASSGVNLKDEEDFLNASYRGARNNASFNTRPQAGSQTMTPQTSFDLLSQNKFGNLGASRSSFQQAPPKQSEEEELFEKHKNAARILAEGNQHPLQNPFLWASSIRRRMQAVARENGLQIPITGLWDRIQDKPESMSGTSMKDSQGHGIQVTKAPSMLNSGSPLDPMLSILSLAGNERLRGLLEDAYGLARGRQIGSDGVVPPDWSDATTGEGEQSTQITPGSATNTGRDSVKITAVNDDPNAKQPIASAENLKTNGEALKGKAVEPVSGIAFAPNPLNAALMALSKRDREAEEVRLKVREARRKRKAQQAAIAATTGSPIDSPVLGSATTSSKTLPPGMLGEKAPEVKMTKKEREKAAKADISEEVAARDANATASMAIGGKQYSWMQGASRAKTLPKPAPSKPTAGGGTGSAASSNRDGLESIKDRTFGNWREDGVGGKGIQLRDWIGVLEQDGREKKTLLQAYVQLDDGLNRILAQQQPPPMLQQRAP